MEASQLSSCTGQDPYMLCHPEASYALYIAKSPVKRYRLLEWVYRECGEKKKMPKKIFGPNEDWREEGYLAKARMEQDRLVQAGRAKLGKDKDDNPVRKTWFGQPRIVIIALVVVVWLVAMGVTAIIDGRDDLQDRSNGITRETALDFCRGDKAEKTSDGWRVDVPQENTICFVKRESDGRIKWERWPLDGDFKNYQPPR